MGGNSSNFDHALGSLLIDLGTRPDPTRSGRHFYNLDEKTRDILLAHARQDAAHAFFNTKSLLERVAELKRLVRLVFLLPLLVAVMLVWQLFR
jgi:hypothetical protein